MGLQVSYSGRKVGLELVCRADFWPRRSCCPKQTSHGNGGVWNGGGGFFLGPQRPPKMKHESKQGHFGQPEDDQHSGVYLAVYNKIPIFVLVLGGWGGRGMPSLLLWPPNQVPRPSKVTLRCLIFVRPYTQAIGVITASPFAPFSNHKLVFFLF
jgi:hypothetical protein